MKVMRQDWFGRGKQMKQQLGGYRYHYIEQNAFQPNQTVMKAPVDCLPVPAARSWAPKAKNHIERMGVFSDRAPPGKLGAGGTAGWHPSER
jgi:hypothetical protein